MAGLDPAIRARRCFRRARKGVDHRVKPGDDDDYDAMATMNERAG